MTANVGMITQLITKVTELKGLFQTDIASRNQFRADLRGDFAAEQAALEQWRHNANPETRYVQDIVIGGSADYFYPVWWKFPGNEGGVSKMTIARRFDWNGGVGERPLDPTTPHQAALLLDLEGNADAWGGDAVFLDVKRYHTRYSQTAANVSLAIMAQKSKIDPNGAGLTGSPAAYSGVFLRGGGLQYRFVTNFARDVVLPTNFDTNWQSVIQTYQNTRYYATPIHKSAPELVEPAPTGIFAP